MISRIDADLKTALLSGDKLKVSVLRSIKSALKNEQINLRRELKDDEIIKILKRESKQRDEAAAGFEQGGASEKAQQEIAEKLIISDYLPEQMSEEQIRLVVDDVITKMNADKSKTGQVIGAVLKEINSQADGNQVAKMVNEALSK